MPPASDSQGWIAAYHAQIAKAKHDLAHVNATIRMFTDVECQRTRYVVSHGFFKHSKKSSNGVRGIA
jgi:hypothetical protein